LIGTFLPLCWLAMMAVHELGHVVGAVATGGRVERVVLHPLTISRTDVSPNPHPLMVVWAGPSVGVLLPLAFLSAAKLSKLTWTYLAQFFAGFCLIANGALHRHRIVWQDWRCGRHAAARKPDLDPLAVRYRHVSRWPLSL